MGVVAPTTNKQTASLLTNHLGVRGVGFFLETLIFL